MNLGRNCRKKCGDLSFQQSPGKSHFRGTIEILTAKNIRGLSTAMFELVAGNCSTRLYKMHSPQKINMHSKSPNSSHHQSCLLLLFLFLAKKLGGKLGIKTCNKRDMFCRS